MAVNRNRFITEEISYTLKSFSKYIFRIVHWMYRAIKIKIKKTKI